MTKDDAGLGSLVQRCPLPEATGMDAMEARLVVVQEVPPQVELRFFAVRGEDREPLSTKAARAALRDHVPYRPPNEMSAIELWAEISVLRTDVDRMRPVYETAKTWRERVRSRPEAFRQGVVVGLADELVAAVDAAIAAEGP